jgi:ABC-type nitrate/sulfonate/bicarbonate transport system substrate-binding protein
LDRGRHDIRRTGPLTLCAALGATVLAVALAACGGDSASGGGSASSGSSSGAGGTVRIMMGSSADATDIVAAESAVEFGSDFGLKESQSDLKRFDSSSTAEQVLISGGGDVLGDSYYSALQLIQKGLPVKVICPVQNGVDNVIVGTDDVTDVSQLGSSKVKVGVDTPNGAGNTDLNMVFKAKDLPLTVAKLPNTTILADHSLRLAALQNGQIDAADIHLADAAILIKALGKDRVHILATMPEAAPNMIYQSFIAKTSWVNSHKDLAARFCASVLKGMQTYKNSFTTYKAMVDKYIRPAPDTASLRETWDLAHKGSIWSTESVSESQFKFNTDIGVLSGLLKPGLAMDQVYDDGPINQARQLLAKAGN